MSSKYSIHTYVSFFDQIIITVKNKFKKYININSNFDSCEDINIKKLFTEN